MCGYTSGCPWEEGSSESCTAILNKNSLGQMPSHPLVAYYWTPQDGPGYLWHKIWWEHTQEKGSDSVPRAGVRHLHVWRSKGLRGRGRTAVPQQGEVSHRQEEPCLDKAQDVLPGPNRGARPLPERPSSLTDTPSKIQGTSQVKWDTKAHFKAVHRR